VDTHLGKYKSLDDPGYTTLAEALATIGAPNVTLTIPAGTVAVSTNTTIPANVNLRVLKGGVFSVAAGATLNINGTIDAGPHQIFEWAGTGVIALGQGSADRYYAQWWGVGGPGCPLFGKRKMLGNPCG